MPAPDLVREMAAIPPPLMTSEPGSFARYTIVTRKPGIVARVLADNLYPPDIQAALDALRAEIAGRPLRLLAETAPDSAFWNEQMAPFAGRTWLELPWYTAEAYFYRRLLEAVHYLQPGPWQGRDPFGPQKRAEDARAAGWWAESGSQIESLPADAACEVLLHSALWGNRADLSNDLVREPVSGGLAAGGERHNLLIDDSRPALALLSTGVGRLDFVNDNTGRELLFDLALADCLLRHGRARQVVFHLKDRPFFVSDAMRRDAQAIVDRLAGMPLGGRLADHLAEGRLVLRDDPFWTTNLMFRDMPSPLAADLARATLVILKGDANYRRLLDDAHWPHTTPVEQIAAYFPAPCLIVRTLKSEIVAGLAPGQAEALAAADPGWLINGRRGLIHLIPGSPRSAMGRA